MPLAWATLQAIWATRVRATDGTPHRAFPTDAICPELHRDRPSRLWLWNQQNEAGNGADFGGCGDGIPFGPDFAIGDGAAGAVVAERGDAFPAGAVDHVVG